MHESIIKEFINFPFPEVCGTHCVCLFSNKCEQVLFAKQAWVGVDQSLDVLSSDSVNFVNFGEFTDSSLDSHRRFPGKFDSQFEFCCSFFLIQKEKSFPSKLK